ncbi:hypothetical protein I4U23_016592 [Adineta vaga]|nr:hypothetical protein I4U23_016592 [Adineta vaga]
MNPYETGNKPEAIFVDRNNNIFVSEAALPHRLLKLSPNGTLTTVIESNDNTFQSCSGIYVDKNDNIYIADWNQSTVFKFDKNGQNREIVAGGNDYGDASNQLSHPKDVFVAEKSGNIYVTDYLNQRIQCWSPGSKVGVTVCGGNNDGDNLNQLNHPWSVIVDNNEKQIYVGDGLNGRVVRWSIGKKQGDIIVGNNDQSKKLSRVGGIAFDQNGNLYVADLNKNVIQKFLIDNEI